MWGPWSCLDDQWGSGGGPRPFDFSGFLSSPFKTFQAHPGHSAVGPGTGQEATMTPPQITRNGAFGFLRIDLPTSISEEAWCLSHSGLRLIGTFFDAGPIDDTGPLQVYTGARQGEQSLFHPATRSSRSVFPNWATPAAGRLTMPATSPGSITTGTRVQRLSRRFGRLFGGTTIPGRRPSCWPARAIAGT